MMSLKKRFKICETRAQNKIRYKNLAKNRKKEYKSSMNQIKSYSRRFSSYNNSLSQIENKLMFLKVKLFVRSKKCRQRQFNLLRRVESKQMKRVVRRELIQMKAEDLMVGSPLFKSL